MSTAVITATESVQSQGIVDDSEFEPDMTVVEATTRLVTMACDTSDGCGEICNGSTCS
ncbi:FxLD family lanthipeptide [Nocardia sp. NRRL S-836]|uniref:FxLD family lanthipeptide n=1 Tax=Nocardia sp. NRRL S-836 TaxID=1519492 RepID=UPI000AA75031|nr:FxLD family lanthipeptide [Nocardia sp. NRRL S-836]